VLQRECQVFWAGNFTRVKSEALTTKRWRQRFFWFVQTEENKFPGRVLCKGQSFPEAP
jgi:hypothetical protein